MTAKGKPGRKDPKLSVYDIPDGVNPKKNWQESFKNGNPVGTTYQTQVKG